VATLIRWHRVLYLLGPALATCGADAPDLAMVVPVRGDVP